MLLRTWPTFSRKRRRRPAWRSSTGFLARRESERRSPDVLSLTVKQLLHVLSEDVRFRYSPDRRPGGRREWLLPAWCGIRATLNCSACTSTSVRLIPSTATDPFGTIRCANSGGTRNHMVIHSPSRTISSTTPVPSDVSLDEMSPEPAVDRERPFQIHAACRRSNRRGPSC